MSRNYRDPRYLFISLVCVVLFLICMALIFSGCSLKSQQIAHPILHAADLGSTYYGEAHGATEANPVFRTNWPVRIALKSVTAVTVIYLTSKVSQEHPRIAKTFLMAANAVLSGVVIHNVGVAR